MGEVFNAVASGSASLAAARILTKVISFAAFYLITVTLSLADYGLVTLALAVSGPALVVAGLGLDDLVAANGARLIGEGKPNESASLLGGFALVKISITGTILLLLIFIKNFLGADYERVLDQFFLPLAIWIAVTALRTLADLAIVMRQRFVWFAAANVAEAAGKLFVVIALFVGHTLSVTTVIWAYVAGKTLSLLLTLPSLPWFLPRARALGAVKDFFAAVRGRGKWEMLRGFFGQLFSGVYNWITALLLGLEAVAVLNVAIAMNSLLQQVLPFRQVIFPIISRLSATEGASAFVARRLVKYSVWTNTLLILLAVIFLPPAVRTYYPKYASALPLFFFLSFSLYLNSLSLSHAPLLQSLGEQKLLLGLSLLGTISSVTVLPALIWLVGLPGVVAEQLLSTGVIVWIRERRLRAAHRLPTFAWRDFVIFDDFDRALFGRLRTFNFAAVLGRGRASRGGDREPPVGDQAERV
ncbi:hypothetical protein EPN90_00405 [Patescibacteria group bacterium]|nr:MAG: hypothetical protein EPN90_00405 [Patescibacteria group bacterium]